MRKECPICGSKTKTLLKTVRFAVPEYFHLPNQYDVVSCDQCGCCYAATEASLGDYDHYYSQCNFYSGVPNEQDWQIYGNNRISELVTAIVDRNGLLLDIGFGKGNLMCALREKGFRHVCGLDPSKDSIQRMREYGFPVYEGSIFGSTVPALAGKCDCIFLIDVLEHLLYPDLAIDKIKSYLKEQGTLIISVPNYAALLNTDLYSAPPIIPDQFNQEHINYFSPVSLDNLLRKHGFARVENEHAICFEKNNGAELLVAYQYSETSGKPKQFQSDSYCPQVLQKYFEQNNILERTIDEKLALFSNDGRPVYVWGTGSYAMWLLANTAAENLDIEAFIDNNPTKLGKTLNGIQIISPKEMKSDIPILICAMRYSSEIIEQIKMGQLLNPYFVI